MKWYIYYSKIEQNIIIEVINYDVNVFGKPIIAVLTFVDGDDFIEFQRNLKLVKNKPSSGSNYCTLEHSLGHKACVGLLKCRLHANDAKARTMHKSDIKLQMGLKGSILWKYSTLTGYSIRDSRNRGARKTTSLKASSNDGLFLKDEPKFSRLPLAYSSELLNRYDSSSVHWVKRNELVGNSTLTVSQIEIEANILSKVSSPIGTSNSDYQLMTYEIVFNKYNYNAAVDRLQMYFKWYTTVNLHPTYALKFMSCDGLFNCLTRVEIECIKLIIISALTRTLLVDHYQLTPSRSMNKLSALYKRIMKCRGTRSSIGLVRLMPNIIMTISMDMFTGKSYIANKFPGIFIDVDTLVFNEQEFNERIKVALNNYDPESMNTVDWNTVSQITAEAIIAYLNRGGCLTDKILLVHNSAFSMSLPFYRIVNLGSIALNDDDYELAKDARVVASNKNNENSKWLIKIAELNRASDPNPIKKIFINRNQRNEYLYDIVSNLYRPVIKG